MEKNIRNIIILGLLAIVYSCSSEQISHKKSVINKSEIETISAYKTGYNSLLNKANKTLHKEFRSVIDKDIIPPSGDKHDYLSRAVYYWPNPNTSNGLPWIYMDGKYNKKSFSETDHKYYYEAMEAIRDLSLAYNLSKDSKYAKRAIEIITKWFTDKKTKMNPNLNYAQGIPGKYDGTKSGIIDSRAIIWVIQGIEFIKPSGLFTVNNEKQFKQWCGAYLDWLLTSQFGKDEGKSKNNHGTYYDLQVVSFADYVGRNKIVIEVLDSVRIKRIEKQILPDGAQPLELSRTRSHMYSVFNLSALVDLAELGDKYKIDLWDYKTKDCGSIKDAIDFLVKNSSKNSSKLFKDKINTKNLLRILPKADTKFSGEYSGFLNTELKKNKNIDLTSVFFVN